MIYTIAPFSSRAFAIIRPIPDTYVKRGVGPDEVEARYQCHHQ
jgi:hypothetical protein